MRILKYMNEKFGKCEFCGTEFAYTDEDIIGVSSGDCINSVSNFLKWIHSDKKLEKQLFPKHIAAMKLHPDWVCCSDTIERFVVCPHCEKKVSLTDQIDFIEIYPEGSEIVGSGEVVSDQKMCWYKFNKLEHEL